MLAFAAVCMAHLPQGDSEETGLDFHCYSINCILEAFHPGPQAGRRSEL